MEAVRSYRVQQATHVGEEPVDGGRLHPGRRADGTGRHRVSALGLQQVRRRVHDLCACRSARSEAAPFEQGLEHHDLGVGVAQELPVGDVPPVGAGAAEDQHVTHAQTRHRLGAGQHVTRACTAHRRRPRRLSRTSGGGRGGPTAPPGSTVNGWLHPQAAGQPEVVGASTQHREPAAVDPLEVEHLGGVPAGVGGQTAARLERPAGAGRQRGRPARPSPSRSRSKRRRPV